MRKARVNLRVLFNRKPYLTLDVSRAGYYDWCKRPPSKHELSNRQLDMHIQAIFMEHKVRYGSPRITDELIDRGIPGSENRVCARMKTLNLRPKQNINTK